jgi:collagenase-like PrtC family protease
MAQLGVDIMRISPQSAHTAEIAALFKRALLYPGEVVSVAVQLDGLAAGETCNGYWHGAAGIERVPAHSP